MKGARGADEIAILKQMFVLRCAASACVTIEAEMKVQTSKKSDYYIDSENMTVSWGYQKIKLKY